MHPVLANDLMTKGAPRAPSLVALALSVCVHGAFLGAIGEHPLPSPTKIKTSDPDNIITLSVTMQEPQAVLARTAPIASRPAPPPIVPTAAKTLPPAEKRPVPPKAIAASQPAPRPPTPLIANSTLANPPEPAPAIPREITEKISAAVDRPTATDSAQQRTPSRGSVLILPVYSPPPHYPVQAKRMGLEGRVLMRVMVAANGIPVDVQIVAGSGHSILDRAALDAVRSWRFQVNGSLARNSVEAVQVPIRFDLE